ncbi:MAG: exo-alpha-sialidase [Rhizobacter sp.]
MGNSHRGWVATRKGLFELGRQGKGWEIARVSFLAEPVSMLLPPTASGRMLAALNLGHFGVKVHASDDAGATWREVGTPAYPPQPADATGVPWKLVQIWSMESVAGALWAGTLPGGLFRSGDGGETWQLVDSFWSRPERAGWFGGGYDVPGIHSILPHPTRPGELLLGISCGGVWGSREGGTQWALQAKGMRADFMPPEQAGDENIQDPHLIAAGKAQPGTLWCQHHNGIFKSTDGSVSWQEVKAPLSSFGFAVAAHPSDPNTAWFAPAIKDEKRVPVDGAMVVNRTRDGGRSFETLRKGLPQKDCYDLVYRHGLAVDDSGTSLLMGSTTGNLWASDDGGDSWLSVSTHLPPIHAVKFG